MATEKKQLGIRFSSERYEYLKQLESELGLSKNAVVEMMVDFYRSHTQSVSTLDKASIDNGLSLVNGVSTMPKSVSTIKGADAQLVLMDAKVVSVKSGTGDSEQVTFHDGWLWLIHSSANGSQKVLRRIVEYPESLFNALAERVAERVYEKYSLAAIKEAPTRLKELQSLPGAEEYIAENYIRTSIYGFSFAEDKYYTDLIRSVTKLNQQKEAAIAEATAALEVVNEVIAIETANDATSPYSEAQENTQLCLEVPQMLDHKAFKRMYGLDDAVEFGLACDRARADGYVARDGKLWFLDGSRKAAVWSTTKVAVAV